MRGHGFTAHGSSIQESVSHAIFTQQNAEIQTTALVTHAAYFNDDCAGVHFLDGNEAEAAAEMIKWSAHRPWELWVKEVEMCGLYTNTA